MNVAAVNHALVDDDVGARWMCPAAVVGAVLGAVESWVVGGFDNAAE